MRQLSHTFRDGEAFLNQYHDDGRREELFLLGVTESQAGEQLDLEIRFAHSGYVFRSLAQVLLRRLAGRGSSMAVGTLVSFVGPPLRRGLVAHARNEPIPYHPRQDPRVPCRFPVTIVHRRTREVAEAVDYCPGGVQVVGGPELEVGDAVQLRLHPVGSLFGLALLGQVVWMQRQPEAAYGIHLCPTGNRARRQLQKLYERILARQFR